MRSLCCSTITAVSKTGTRSGFHASVSTLLLSSGCGRASSAREAGFSTAAIGMQRTLAMLAHMGYFACTMHLRLQHAAVDLSLLLHWLARPQVMRITWNPISRQPQAEGALGRLMLMLQARCSGAQYATSILLIGGERPANSLKKRPVTVLEPLCIYVRKGCNLSITHFTTVTHIQTLEHLRNTSLHASRPMGVCGTGTSSAGKGWGPPSGQS